MLVVTRVLFCSVAALCLSSVHSTPDVTSNESKSDDDYDRLAAMLRSHPSMRRSSRTEKYFFFFFSMRYVDVRVVVNEFVLNRLHRLGSNLRRAAISRRRSTVRPYRMQFVVGGVDYC